MDNLFGVIVFVIFAIISLVAKINEERKKTEQRRTYRKPSKEDELPEAVRRMLYGEKTIPTARPAQPRSGDPNVMQVPRVLQEDEEGPARPIPVTIPRPPVQSLNQQRAQQQAMLQRQQQIQQRQTVPVRSQQASVAPQRMQAGQQRQRPVPQRPQGPPPMPQPVAGAARRVQAPAKGQPLTPATIAPQQVPQRRAPATRRTGSVLFRDMRQLRNAIIYSEVLGKPVSLRDE